jgi:transposase-like protein
MGFPLLALRGEDACCRGLVAPPHPGGLACPRCGARDGLAAHRRHRAPAVGYRCAACGRVPNAFTGTSPQGARRPCAALPLVPRGARQGVPTARPARELGRDRKHLLELRRRLRALAGRRAGRQLPLTDPAVEAGEMCQGAGDRRRPAPRPPGPAAAPGQQEAGARQRG